jgi:ATP-dependent RNA helicase DDX60
VHTASVKRLHQYTDLVERFAQGKIQVVLSTGTLAYGINMPTRSVIFFGKSAFITPQMLHQVSVSLGRHPSCPGNT